MSANTRFALFAVSSPTGRPKVVVVRLEQPKHQTPAYMTEVLTLLRQAHVTAARARGNQRTDGALRQDVQILGTFEQLVHTMTLDEAKEAM